MACIRWTVSMLLLPNKYIRMKGTNNKYIYHAFSVYAFSIATSTATTMMVAAAVVAAAAVAATVVVGLVSAVCITWSTYSLLKVGSRSVCYTLIHIYSSTVSSLNGWTRTSTTRNGNGTLLEFWKRSLRMWILCFGIVYRLYTQFCIVYTWCITILVSFLDKMASVLALNRLALKVTKQMKNTFNMYHTD